MCIVTAANKQDARIIHSKDGIREGRETHKENFVSLMNRDVHLSSKTPAMQIAFLTRAATLLQDSISVTRWYIKSTITRTHQDPVHKFRCLGHLYARKYFQQRGKEKGETVLIPCLRQGEWVYSKTKEH